MTTSFALAPSLEEARGFSLQHNLIPVGHSFLDDTLTPVSAFLKLRDRRDCFLLESAEQGRFGRYSFLGLGARESLRLRGDTVAIERNGRRRELELADHGGDPFRFLAGYLGRFHPPVLEDMPPFLGGAVGYIGYDAVRRVESLPDPPPDDLGLPEMAFLITDVLVVFDHLRHTITLFDHLYLEDGIDLEEAYAASGRKLAKVKARLLSPSGGDGPRPPRVRGRAAKPTSTFAEEEFVRAVERAKGHIRAGDVFQVVLSQRFQQPVPVGGFSLYRGMRAVNPSPYMYYFSFGDFEVVGSSPEPLVRSSGRRVETRPVAGTRARGASSAEDAALARQLLQDEKERAEHVMLVDLGRNDLGRVCRPGSVRVAEFMKVDRYSHVMHLASVVEGDLSEGMTAADALRAAFPAGTVSGAPKIKAMELIDQLEPVARGPYAGALGYLSFSGELDSCITIRTVVVAGGTAYIQAGAGIVADSDARREYEETRSKAEAMFRAIELAVGQEGWE